MSATGVISCLLPHRLKHTLGHSCTRIIHDAPVPRPLDLRGRVGSDPPPGPLGRREHRRRLPRTVRAHHTITLHGARARGGPSVVFRLDEVRWRCRTPGGIVAPGVPRASGTRGARQCCGRGPAVCCGLCHRRVGSLERHVRGGVPKRGTRDARTLCRRRSLGRGSRLSGRRQCWRSGREVTAWRWTERHARWLTRQPERRHTPHEAAEEPEADAPGQVAWPPWAARCAGARGWETRCPAPHHALEQQ